MDWSTIFGKLTVDLSPVVAGLLGWAIYHGALYLKNQVSHIKNKEVRDALDWAIGQANGLMQKLVVAANEQTVNALKATGQWDATAAGAITRQVLAKADALLQGEARTILEEANMPLHMLLPELLQSAVAVAPNKTQASPPAKPTAS